VLLFDKGNGPQASPSWFRGHTYFEGHRKRQASDKILCGANGGAVVVKSAMHKQLTLFWADKVLMNELIVLMNIF